MKNLQNILETIQMIATKAEQQKKDATLATLFDTTKPLNLEEWKPVKGFDIYEVSNLGNVRSLDRTVVTTAGVTKNLKGKQLKPVNNNVGNPANDYKMVSLFRDGKPERRYVHRLVLEAFGDGNFETKPCVNHKNGLKYDNRLENLEFVTHSENLLHAYETGLKRSKLTDADAIYIVEHYVKGHKYFGAVPLAKKFKVATSTIYTIANGTKKTRATKHLFDSNAS